MFALYKILGALVPPPTKNVLFLVIPSRKKTSVLAKTTLMLGEGSTNAISCDVFCPGSWPCQSER